MNIIVYDSCSQVSWILINLCITSDFLYDMIVNPSMYTAWCATSHFGLISWPLVCENLCQSTLRNCEDFYESGVRLAKWRTQLEVWRLAAQRLWSSFDFKLRCKFEVEVPYCILLLVLQLHFLSASTFYHSSRQWKARFWSSQCAPHTATCCQCNFEMPTDVSVWENTDCLARAARICQASVAETCWNWSQNWVMIHLFRAHLVLLQTPGADLASRFINAFFCARLKASCFWWVSTCSCVEKVSKNTHCQHLPNTVYSWLAQNIGLMPIHAHPFGWVLFQSWFMREQPTLEVSNRLTVNNDQA